MSPVNNEKDTIKISRVKKKAAREGSIYKVLHIKTLKYGILWGSIKCKKRDLTFDGLNDFFGKV